MFTGFSSENTPAIQVWDFFSSVATSNAVPSVSLADDCAPIQLFRTGGTTTSINVYLPTAPIEGKTIRVINTLYSSSRQIVRLLSSENSGEGASSLTPVYSIGVGQVLDLTYTKNAISYGSAPGLRRSGWVSTNMSPASARNSGSVIAGGKDNHAAANFCGVFSGENNIATSDYSFVGGGIGNSASQGYSSVVGGQNNTISNPHSFIGGGENNNASATHSAALSGFVNAANGAYSFTAGGARGTTRSITGNVVLPASFQPVSTTTGAQQSGLLILGRQTTDATATVLASNTSAATTTNQVILPNNSAYTFQGTCVANVTGGGDSSGWKFEGVIKRGANAASTVLVAAVTPIVIAQDAGASTWVLAITADTTNGGIAVTVTGAAATTIRWVAKIETTEVTF
jgi:hypothetical protein